MTTPYPTDTRPAPAHAIEMARAALLRHSYCFWFRSENAPVETIAEIELIIRRLRQNGGVEAWNTAYQLKKSLSTDVPMPKSFPINRSLHHGDTLRHLGILAEKARAMGFICNTGTMVDLVTNHAVFPLHAVVWAACANDTELNPMSLLELMRRFSKIDVRALAETKVDLTPVKLKQRWLAIAEEAEINITAAADAGIEIGVVFLTPDGSVKWFDTPGAVIHRAVFDGTQMEVAA